VSHEAIYQALYLQGRGELRRELTEALRTGRDQTPPQGAKPGRGSRAKIVDPVRSPNAPPRPRTGRCPGTEKARPDPGPPQPPPVGVPVERSTRFAMLLHLPANRRAGTVRDPLAAKITELPQALKRSLTWDQGREMARHRSFTIDIGSRATHLFGGFLRAERADAVRSPHRCSLPCAHEPTSCVASGTGDFPWPTAPALPFALVTDHLAPERRTGHLGPGTSSAVVDQRRSDARAQSTPAESGMRVARITDRPARFRHIVR
jgi:hypothetical protein